MNVTDVYDALAPEYDERYSSPEAIRENNVVKHWVDAPVPFLSKRRVLDIGCGTGLLIDLLGHKITPEHYTGVDPSEKMLARFRAKHPEYAPGLWQQPFSDFQPRMTYDVIVSLFGAASYLSGRDVWRIRQLLAPQGRALLMFYRPGYLPDYYGDDQPSTVNESREIGGSIADNVFEWHNFTVVTRG